MKRLRLTIALLAAAVYVVAPSALAAEPAAGTPVLDFGQQCETIPAETELSGPGIVLPRFTPANPPSQPDYPAASQQRAERGTVHMLSLVNEQGRVTRVKLIKSTGHPTLDRIGLEATRAWKLAPGTVDGKAQCMWRKFTLTWLVDPANLPAPALQLADAMLAEVFFRARFVVQASRRRSPAEVECWKTADLSGVRTAHAAALAAALTSAELIEALVFFSSPVGDRYAQSGQLQSSIATGIAPTERPSGFTDEEYAAVSSFLATSAGRKLVDKTALKTDDLTEELSQRMLPTFRKCRPASSSQQ